MECVVAVLCTGQEALRGRQGWAPGAPAREGWVGEHGACPGPNPPRMARSGSGGWRGACNSQLRRRKGQTRRLLRQRVAATPTPPVTATITQW